MPHNDDLAIFLDDFGLECKADGITAKGILDMPTQILSGDVILSTDYTLRALTSDFGALIAGNQIKVDGIAYKVREVQTVDDGKFCEVALQRT